MSTPDNRLKFNHVIWRQGHVLETRTTRLWSKQTLEQVSRIERRCAFAYFCAHDEGRSRELVYQFDSAEECAKAVNEHNKALAEALSK
ncbi:MULTISPECIES: hypothetical protein [unclassified Shewanella]|uniref:hypothetical protein n=1 Tax=Shewanella TaxID=22 RepID=UPI001C5B6B27|nr:MULTISPECIES: hypothetical protein [unclassified Shewanella]MBW3514949.1 hypothetical protein [Shewanella sp. NKUCC01_JLK]MCU8044379.1 hypothetical protein [Shewanella sp. SM68]MCU8048461.1 hypothetical protein [Shewanella sp. SM65]